MMPELLARLDAIGILVNNAVVRYFAPVEMFPPEGWQEALAATCPLQITRLALPGMKRRGWGRIVNMGPIYSARATLNRVDCVTTKTAILGLSAVCRTPMQKAAPIGAGAASRGCIADARKGLERHASVL
jgi:3-hydroxybutyrate dehydrogenase